MRSDVIMNIYEIQAFAYSDFEHHILLHKEKFTEEELTEMIDKAREETRPEYDEYGLLKNWVNYPDEFIRYLINEFGFEYSKHKIIYVGCGNKDKLEFEDGGY